MNRNLQRFQRSYRVDPATGCWIWQLYRTPYGYGHFMIDGRCRKAHRWSYEQHVGPIPDGLVLDHLCRTPACVNPDHLEPVTTRENTIERGMGQRAITYRTRECLRGHLLTVENTYSPPNDPTVRQCAECRRIRGLRRRTLTSQEGTA